MRDLYNRVNEVLNKIDFEAIHPGFRKCEFALYDDSTVYMSDKEIPIDKRFLGNTAIAYEGDYMAIWKIDDISNVDVDILAADMVHEMYHAYQYRVGLEYCPDDRMMLMYPQNMDNYHLKYAENQILVEIYKADGDRKVALLQSFEAMREKRKHIIGEFYQQELEVEGLEGAAEYAGCCALRQIALKKAKERINGYIEQLQKADESFFDIRRMSYFTGTIYNLATEDIHQRDVQGLEEIYNQLQNKRQQIIDDFINSDTELVEESGIFCGYDPMNMFRVVDKIYCSHFAFIMTGETPKYINGPVLLYMEEGSRDKIKLYRRMK